MKHGIEWLNFPDRKGETWNPWGGCSKVSAGCENCWALRQANRFKNHHKKYVGTVLDGSWTGKINRATPKELFAPMGWRDPRAVFPCSMSDFFHEGADNWRGFAWRSIYEARQHIFLILTKRPERIPECLPTFKGGKENWPWPHVWLGASVENQEMVDKRAPELLRVPAAKRFLSLEPLLGPIDLSKWLCKDAEGVSAFTGEKVSFRCGIRWIIVGGESGPGARPMEVGWVQSIRDQCQAAGVPFFMKQMAKRAPIPEDLRIREFPE